MVSGFLVFKYDDTKTAEGRKLTYQDLVRPHLIILSPSNIAAATRLRQFPALQKADVNEKTPDPPGGQIGRIGWPHHWRASRNLPSGGSCGADVTTPAPIAARASKIITKNAGQGRRDFGD